METSSISHVSGVITKRKERIMQIFGNSIGRGSNNRVEIAATWWWIKRLKALSFQKIILEGDSKYIFSSLDREVATCWDTRIMMEESKTLLRSFLHSKVQFFFRENNNVMVEMSNVSLYYNELNYMHYSQCSIRLKETLSKQRPQLCQSTI